MERLPKPFYYLEVAKQVASRSTCLSKQYGAVIVKDDRIISTGYNGAPRGRINCCDRGTCLREELDIPRGFGYSENCAAVHAEQNAIIFADYADMVDSELYLYGWDLKRNAMVQAPNICKLCQRMIINADIRAVIIADPDNGIPNAQTGYGARTILVQDWVDHDDSYDPDGGDYANYRV